jgi:serine/threonine-protein kinase ATR
LKGNLQVFDLISFYRKAAGVPSDGDYLWDIKSYEGLDHAARIRKIQGTSRERSALDLARAIVVTSANSLSWIQRSSTFARSMGLLAGISYVFGSVDTSLSGILFEKSSGATNYARFKITGEVSPVPFRLTHMIVSALGTAGVSGPFLASLTSSLKCMRKNCRSIATILQVFICNTPWESARLPRQYCEPFVKNDVKSEEIDLLYGRIAGEEESDRLIEKARSLDNIAAMPAWWRAWW